MKNIAQSAGSRRHEIPSPLTPAKQARTAFAVVGLGFVAALALGVASGVASASNTGPGLGVVRVRAASEAAGSSAGAHVPSAIYTDPPADPAHPAQMTVLHIPSHGVEINGIMYSPPGAGPHPTLVICHGLPGNEKNLDLAQAVRRAGWNAVTFNYRGSWGSPGAFRFTQNPEDAAAALAFLRDPVNASKLGVDPGRIALAGHSMGGWVTALTAAHDKTLLGAVLISMADLGRIGEKPRKDVVEIMADDKETLAGVTAESMADEVIAHAKDFSAIAAAEGLTRLPLLVLSSDDGLSEHAAALVQAIKGKGGTRVTTRHVATDHGWSDHRIALESEVIGWLGQLPGAKGARASQP